LPIIGISEITLVAPSFAASMAMPRTVSRFSPSVVRAASSMTLPSSRAFLSSSSKVFASSMSFAAISLMISDSGAIKLPLIDCQAFFSPS